MTVCYEFLFRKEKKRKEKIKYDIKFGNPCFILYSKAFFSCCHSYFLIFEVALEKQLLKFYFEMVTFY